MKGKSTRVEIQSKQNKKSRKLIKKESTRLKNVNNSKEKKIFHLTKKKKKVKFNLFPTKSEKKNLSLIGGHREIKSFSAPKLF